MKKTIILVLFSVILAMQSCDYAQSNVQTLYTDDCGQNWKVIGTGETVPSQVGVCAYKVTIPDYPMQGECKFKTSFAHKVLADIEVTYDYSILDGVKYISDAKYLGKENSASSDDTNSSGVYETAENAVIDTRIKEASRKLLVDQDIVDFSQAKFEAQLLDSVNAMLATRGVKMNFLSFTPIPEEQTRLAIDVVNANRIYKSNGLEAVGAEIAAARASATRITVQNTVPRSE